MDRIRKFFESPEDLQGQFFILMNLRVLPYFYHFPCRFEPEIVFLQ